MVPESLIEKVATAIESAEVGYRLMLTRLVEGVHTYELTYSDGQRLEFDNTDAAYEHVARTKRTRSAQAAIAAVQDWAGKQPDCHRNPITSAFDRNSTALPPRPTR